MQQRAGFFQAAAGDQQAHVVKAGIVVAGIGGHGFGQFLQGGLGVALLHELLGLLRIGFGVQSVFAGQVFVQELAHLALGLCAHKTIHGLAADHQHTGGHAAHAKHGGNLLVGIDIDFRQDKAPAVIGLQLLQHGHQRFAGAAPGGPKIDQHRGVHRGGDHLGFKRL